MFESRRKQKGGLYRLLSLTLVKQNKINNLSTYIFYFILQNIDIASKSSTQKDRSSINEGWSLIWLCYQVQVYRHVVTSWYSPQLSGHLVIFSAATWSPRDILRSYVVTKLYSPRPRGHLEIFSVSTWSPRDILRVHVITSWHSLRPRGHLVIMFRSTAMWSPRDIVTHNYFCQSSCFNYYRNVT